MSILTRYLLRAHLGPFLFALTTMTGLLFLQTVARKLKDYSGKGLPPEVIFEFMYLSIPHIVALTLPMTVLVAVLYAFSDMAANNEVTAIKAGGVPPTRLMRPMLLAGLAIAGVMFYFNDQVLPESNHRLKNLTLDVNRKAPTFSLREQVVNPIEASASRDRYAIRAVEIDNTTSKLFDVTIVDQNDPLRQRVTVADSGVMAFNASRTDLYLTLFDGRVLETTNDPPGNLQQVLFEKQVIPLRGIGNELEREFSSERGDREMTLGMLAEAAREREQNRLEVEREGRERLRSTVRAALGDPVADSALTVPANQPQLRAGAMRTEGTALQKDNLTSAAVTATTTSRVRVEAHRQARSRLEVEIHKKLTLSFACIVFVLVGGPLAMRFPRGGVGTVIVASSVIFAVYWSGLIAGETLADRNVAPPALTMWLPNVIFTIIGIGLYRRMGRETGTSRGGGWGDLLLSVRDSLVAPFRRGPRGEQPQGA